MSGFGTFSHIYQDEPADPLPPQPLPLLSLLSQVFTIWDCVCSRSLCLKLKLLTLLLMEGYM